MGHKTSAKRENRKGAFPTALFSTSIPNTKFRIDQVITTWLAIRIGVEQKRNSPFKSFSEGNHCHARGGTTDANRSGGINPCVASNMAAVGSRRPPNAPGILGTVPAQTAEVNFRVTRAGKRFADFGPERSGHVTRESQDTLRPRFRSLRPGKTSTGAASRAQRNTGGGQRVADFKKQ